MNVFSMTAIHRVQRASTENPIHYFSWLRLPQNKLLFLNLFFKKRHHKLTIRSCRSVFVASHPRSSSTLWCCTNELQKTLSPWSPARPCQLIHRASVRADACRLECTFVRSEVGWGWRLGGVTERSVPRAGSCFLPPYLSIHRTTTTRRTVITGAVVHFCDVIPLQKPKIPEEKLLPAFWIQIQWQLTFISVFPPFLALNQTIGHPSIFISMSQWPCFHISADFLVTEFRTFISKF